MIGAFVDFVLQVANGCHLRTVVQKSVAPLTAMSGPLDFYAALPAQGLDAPHKLATSHTLSVGQKCPEGNRKRGGIEDPGRQKPVDLEEVWNVASARIPELQAVLEQFLAGESPDSPPVS